MKTERRPTVVTPPEGCSSYLTAGKPYEVLEYIVGENVDSVVINDDCYGQLQTNFPQTAHLNDRKWIVLAWSDDVSSVVDADGQFGFEF